jgi:hypothetical protein
MSVRCLHAAVLTAFRPDGAGSVTFLVYSPDDFVLVVKIQGLGD